MPSFCAVSNCTDKYGHAESISFHKFPFKRKDLLRKWKNFTQRGADWTPSKWSAICSRHFEETDFSCINERKTLKKMVVPTKHPPAPQLDSGSVVGQGSIPWKASTNVANKIPKCGINNNQELNNLMTTNSTGIEKSVCRFCGAVAGNCISFAQNLEVFGTIQKCFPTLQIRQNDCLPTDICASCHECIKRFACFVDKVLESSSELQRQYRVDGCDPHLSTTAVSINNSNCSAGSNERQMKIKQEPFVRVKQEIAEGFDQLFSDDLEMGIEDVCEPDQPVDEIEQKFHFCDFPAMLNVQDIINNCDIMEIINLDDQFINIADDDVAQSPKLLKNQTHSQAAKRVPEIAANANGILQTELLSEEHNYANPVEEQKELWQLKSNYKLEKVDNSELVEKKQVQIQSSDVDVINQNQLAPVSSTAPRSTKPIVTNVSQIQNPLLRDLLPSTNTTGTEQTTVKATTVATATASNKPNIVVLHDSIVSSSDAFRLHTCHICASKFFTNESLRQHCTLTHAATSMALASDSNTTNMQTSSMASGQSFKVETNADHRTTESSVQKTLVTPNVAQAPSQSVNPLQTVPENYWHTEWSSVGDANSQLPSASVNMAQLPKSLQDIAVSNQSHINILEQSYVRETDYGGMLNDNNGYQLSAQNMPLSQEALQPPLQQNAHYQQTQQSTLPSAVTVSATNVSTEHHLAVVTESFAKLQQQYRQLQRKCRQLRVGSKHRASKYVCQRCKQHFRNVHELLRHKRTQLHFIDKPRNYSAKCCGCLRNFYSRLALQQHMRFICQSLPLRCVSVRLQNFKCRLCQAITFTHWRLYRRHAVKCKARMLSQRKVKSTVRISKTRGVTSTAIVTAASGTALKSPTLKRSFDDVTNRASCSECGKQFANANRLNQHRITHTSERRHKCSICGRFFKRRNGLSQHIKGYHMQIKPHACPVCKHCYALKCDMLRCRHSQLRGCSE